VNTNSNKSDWTGNCIYSPDEKTSPATAIEFNPTFTNLAIGTLQGVVHIYELAVDELGIKATFSHAVQFLNTDGINYAW
jgi:hypothetical protein